MSALRLSVCAVLLVSATAAPAQITFTRVADINTAPPGPGGGPNFLAFSIPSVSGSTVHFGGTSAGETSGLFAWTAAGGVTRTVGNTTAVPGASGQTFTFASNPSASGTAVAFDGHGSGATPARGLYLIGVGGMTRIADTTSTPPGAPGPFDAFSGRVTYRDGRAAFLASGSGYGGVYTWTAAGGLTTATTYAASPPGTTETFDGLYNPIAESGTSVLFRGSTPNTDGVYRWTTTGVSTVVNTQTTAPGGGNFEYFDHASSGEGLVGFLGGGIVHQQQGLYTIDSGGTIRTVADTSTAVPVAGGLFTQFHGLTDISGGRVVFKGLYGSNQAGLFLAGVDGSGLTKLIATGDTLDGRVVTDLWVYSGSLADGNLAMLVWFSGGSQGVYFTPVPEPGLLLAACAGVLALARRSRRLTPTRT